MEHCHSVVRDLQCMLICDVLHNDDMMYGSHTGNQLYGVGHIYKYIILLLPYVNTCINVNKCKWDIL